MGIVYIHTNLRNNKSYVGQTWNPRLRELDHQNPSRKSNFSSAVQKYGWDNFMHYSSDELSTQKEMDNLEVIWMILLQSSNKEFGYNVRLGGSHGKHSEETKAIIRKKRALQGPPSEEGRRKISETHRGRKYGLGYKHTPEARAKISATHKGCKQDSKWIAKRVEARRKTLAERKLNG